MKTPDYLFDLDDEESIKNVRMILQLAIDFANAGIMFVPMPVATEQEMSDMLDKVDEITKKLAEEVMDRRTLQ